MHIRRRTTTPGLIRPTTYVALVAAGLLSVVVFPVVSLRLLGGRADASSPVGPAEPVPTA